jgi:hypothetical protein
MGDLLAEAAAPMITFGSTESEGQIITFWLDSWPNNKAHMEFGGRREGALRVLGDCPEPWLPLVLDTWAKMRAGADVSGIATHKLNTQRWAATRLDEVSK